MKLLQKMVSALLTSVILMGFGSALSADTGVAINETNFPDPYFREYILRAADTNGNKTLDASEKEQFTEIHYYTDNENSYLTKAESFEGIKYLTHLQTLYVSGCEVLDLDLAKMKNLIEVHVLSSATTHLEVGSTVMNVEIKDCRDLYYMDFSQAYNLKFLDIYQFSYMAPGRGTLPTLDLSNCDDLLKLSLDNYFCKEVLFSDYIETLTVVTTSSCKKLKYLDFTNCKDLKSLDLGGAYSVRGVDLPSGLANICNSTYLVSSEYGVNTYKGNGYYLVY